LNQAARTGAITKATEGSIAHITTKTHCADTGGNCQIDGGATGRKDSIRTTCRSTAEQRNVGVATAGVNGDRGIQFNGIGDDHRCIRSDVAAKLGCASIAVDKEADRIARRNINVAANRDISTPIAPKIKPWASEAQAAHGDISRRAGLANLNLARIEGIKSGLIERDAKARRSPKGKGSALSCSTKGQALSGQTACTSSNREGIGLKVHCLPRGRQRRAVNYVNCIASSNCKIHVRRRSQPCPSGLTTEFKVPGCDRQGPPREVRTTGERCLAGRATMRCQRFPIKGNAV